MFFLTLCLLFIIRLRFPTGKSIAEISKEMVVIKYQLEPFVRLRTLDVILASSRHFLLEPSFKLANK